MTDRLNTVSSSVPFKIMDSQDVERGEGVSNSGSGCSLGRKVVKVAIGVCSVLAIGGIAALVYILATHNPPQAQPYADGGEIPWGGRNITDYPSTNYIQ